MRRALGRLAPAADALRVTVADPDLRRLMTAWFASWTGKGAFLVTNLVIAYGAGGPGAVAIVGVASYLPQAVLAPFAGLPTARWRAEQVLLLTNMVRVAAVVIAAMVLAADAPIGWLYVAVALEAAAGAFTWPLHMALLPCLARTPAQLVGANVTSTAAEGVGSTVGPVLGGIMVAAIGGVGADIAVVAIYLVGATALLRVRAADIGRGQRSAREVVAQFTAGLGALRHLPGPRLVTLGFVAQTFVRGLLTVLVVVAAIDLLDMGDQGVGTLTAAIGLGSVAGALAATTLAGHERLVPTFVIALAAWGLPIASVGLAPMPVVAVAAMVVTGVSNAFLDVAGYTLIQRTSTNESRVAVLGIVDGVTNVAVAAGGVAAPLLVAALGLEGALIATGLFLPVVAVAMWSPFGRVEESGRDRAHRAALLHRVPLLAPLSLASVEFLADRLQPIQMAAGGWLMREGEVGDRYVVIEAGHVEITRGGIPVRRDGPGSGVGEIALIRDIPRTASVRAIDDVTGYAVGRDAFLEAVTGHPSSESLARAFTERRLQDDQAVA